MIYGVVGGPFRDQKAIARLSSNLPFDFRADDIREFAVARKDVRFFDQETGLRTGEKPI